MKSFDLRLSLTHFGDPDQRELEDIAQRLLHWLHETDGDPWCPDGVSIDGVDVETT